MWDQIKEFFSGFTSVSDWPARWRCGYWSDFHGWLYIISDLMIWFAYFMIPLVIIRFALKRKNIQFYKAYVLFAAFILLCGTTHFLDAVMFWIPVYRVNAAVRFLTGVVSLITVYHIIKILPEAFKLKTSAELQAEIEQRIDAEDRLEESNKKLLEANKGLEAFAYVASHDLQEPLRKIKTYSTIIQERTELDESVMIYFNKINEASDRMRALIDDVLALSSLNTSVEMTTLDPNKPIDNALKDLEIKIQEKQALIQVDQLPKISGNEAYLTQLFLNIISNALKFTEKQPVIRITGTENKGSVLIKIADNGIGIAEEDIEKIFGAFNRLHPRHVYEGSGIGLAICKRIIDIHHGSIFVESTVGKGTTFLISLPWAFSRNRGKNH